ncbi:MAG: histidine phosphatase family protein [Propionibacteriaceae bacterium]|jgi:probable phosphoglycerate mutase|nr:histidine phosphatase family protein [Propionibacteriaceae bacterium]
MTDLTLVRHGETTWAKSGRHTSVTDLELTETGRARALSLRETVDPADFDLVLVSPRRRARQTAELAGFTDYEVDDDLAEWFYGDFEGKTKEEIQAIVPGWTIWTTPIPGGETADEVVARLSRVAARVRGSGARHAICFAHGHSLRVLALAWLGLPIRYGDLLDLGTASVSLLDDDETPLLRHWNMTRGPLFPAT